MIWEFETKLQIQQPLDKLSSPKFFLLVPAPHLSLRVCLSPDDLIRMYRRRPLQGSSTQLQLQNILAIFNLLQSS